MEGDNDISLSDMDAPGPEETIPDLTAVTVTSSMAEELTKTTSKEDVSASERKTSEIVSELKPVALAVITYGPPGLNPERLKFPASFATAVFLLPVGT